MLILRRKKGETFFIGDEITVTIVSMENGSVDVGIDAPRNIIICREEIYEKKSNPNVARVECKFAAKG